MEYTSSNTIKYSTNILCGCTVHVNKIKIPGYNTILLVIACVLNKLNVTSISDYLTKPAEEQLTAD